MTHFISNPLIVVAQDLLVASPNLTNESSLISAFRPSKAQAADFFSSKTLNAALAAASNFHSSCRRDGVIWHSSLGNKEKTKYADIDFGFCLKTLALLRPSLTNQMGPPPLNPMKYPQGPNPAGMRQGQCMHLQGLNQGKKSDKYLMKFIQPEKDQFCRQCGVSAPGQASPQSSTKTSSRSFLKACIPNHRKSQPVCKKLPDFTVVVNF